VELVLASVANYLPNLFIVSSIPFLACYTLRLLKPFFLAVDRGSLVIPGIYADWGRPTYNLPMVLVIALATVLAFPCLPGFHSPAFQGVSVFLGLLLSLGSTSVVLAGGCGGVCVPFLAIGDLSGRVFAAPYGISADLAGAAGALAGGYRLPFTALAMVLGVGGPQGAQLTCLAGVVVAALTGLLTARMANTLSATRRTYLREAQHLHGFVFAGGGEGCDLPARHRLQLGKDPIDPLILFGRGLHSLAALPQRQGEHQHRLGGGVHSLDQIGEERGELPSSLPAPVSRSTTARNRSRSPRVGCVFAKKTAGFL
jgi:hypothetical protein